MRVCSCCFPHSTVVVAMMSSWFMHRFLFYPSVCSMAVGQILSLRQLNKKGKGRLRETMHACLCMFCVVFQY